ncbi:PREDICTED: meteorin [Elephantulus edwardii]|uniref:meteorin n=1 Tax=Elephantulus edwardii TaxID=28737 RepID=UPI0003F06BDD|nr:PREDICTED: meteorin [Elephantulus edwardii]
MLRPGLLGALCRALLAAAALAGYSGDRCSWTGSGLTQEPGSVRPLALSCAEGTVEWLYPAGALRITLGHPDPDERSAIACLRPARHFAGAQVFVERAGGSLVLLLTEAPGLSGGRCVRWGPGEHRALFLQATLHGDISRRVAAFRFELREVEHPELLPQAHGLSADSACRPCSDIELLLTACTGDFVIHGTIQGVTHDTELQESVIQVTATRILRHTLSLSGTGGGVQTSIRTPLHCGVHPGPGAFLFMGWSRFGEAWLGCAPRVQEFSRVYEAANAAHLLPCEVALGKPPEAWAPYIRLFSRAWWGQTHMALGKQVRAVAIGTSGKAPAPQPSIVCEGPSLRARLSHFRHHLPGPFPHFRHRGLR